MVLAVILGGVLIGQTLRANSITLTGTIRDFHYNGTSDAPLAGHIDFENVISDDRGIVTSTLGADGAPVYAHPGSSTVTTHGEGFFNQWYHDTPGVNLSELYAITLTETAPGSGVYSYDNSAFFPIDNQLGGNQGSSHNYSFTYQIHTTFTYQPGQVFGFTGDDDVWVFIDKKLALDLGGVHGAESASIALDSLGLTAGNTYDFDFFFAERHTTESNLRIQTSIALVNNTPPNILKNVLIPGTNVSIGQTFSYEISFDTYSSSVAAAGLRIVDTLPAEVDFVAVTTNGALSAVYDVGTRTVTWDFGTWPPLAAGPTNYLTVQLNTNAVGGATIVNSATITSSNLPPVVTRERNPRCPTCPSGIVVVSNSAPVAICQSLTVSNDPGMCSATVTPAQVGGSSYDPEGTAVTLTLTPPGPYPVGNNAVTLTVTDTNGLSASCSATIVVVDAEPPAITCPANIIVDFTGATGTVVTFSASAVDQCPGPVAIAYSPPPGSVFPIGTNTVAVMAADAARNSNSCSFQITVRGARGVKQECLADLIALRARVTDRDCYEELDEAIRHWSNSLNHVLWIDETHLQLRKGETVFNEEREAVEELVELLHDRDDGDWDHYWCDHQDPGHWHSEFTWHGWEGDDHGCNISNAVLHGFIDCMTKADRLLAVIAVDESAAAGAKPQKVAEDRREIARGDTDAARGKYEEAIDHYRNAWKHAVRVQIRGGPHWVNGMLHLEFLVGADEIYEIEASTNLRDWATIGMARPDAEGQIVFDDTQASHQPLRYYRVVLRNP